MIKVGVTGGIGSGKTTLCKEWEKLGAYVVYADDLAKKIMVEDKKLVSAIKSVFGEEAYFSDGSLNRSFLAKAAFENERVEELNDLVHPTLWKAVETVAKQKEKEGVEVFVKEAAILLKNGRPKNLDYVVLVRSDKKERIERVVKRDNTKKEKVLNRMNKQQDFSSLSHLSDFEVVNNAGLSDLKKEAQKLFEQIRKF
ncbi:MAG: dephospho-CoA kinase [Balneola sp.]